MTAHVLMTANSAWGIAHFRRPLVAALRASGHDVTVLAPPDDAVDLLAQAGCRFRPLEMDSKGLNPVADLALMRRLKRHFRNERPDVVLSYTIKNNIWGAFAAGDAGLPFIPNVSGLGTAFLSGGPLQKAAELLYSRAFRHLEHVFFQNPEDRDLFLTRGLVREAQARLIPGSGVDLDHFRPVPMPRPDAPPSFLMIGRVIRDKGVMEYAEAARIVRQERPDAQFRLLGGLGVANRGAVPAEQVAAWEAAGTLAYLGTCADVRPAISAAHCVVLPSYREGAPRALIEASAMGRPVIATDVPGCRSVVADGETGLLCAAKNGPALAEACLGFLGLSSAEQGAMGAAGRRRMEAIYDQRLVVEAYFAALGSASSPAGLGQTTSAMKT
ncbi:MAG: glycosyltransferase family 4 protein [Thermaurantiacus sp.]